MVKQKELTELFRTCLGIMLPLTKKIGIKKLPVAEFAVNNAWHDTIQNTPFFLNYGQHPLTPVTMLTENIVPSPVAFGRGLE